MRNNQELAAVRFSNDYEPFLALGMVGCDLSAPEPLSRPDILFVILDTVRADKVSSYGYERPTTPPTR